MNTTMMGRRAVLSAFKAIAFSCVFVLSACSPSPQFLNQNVTGSGYATQVELKNASGGTVQLSAPAPKQVTALFFGFTQCPDVCPTTLGTMKLVKQELIKNKIDADRLRIVFVSIDPERDTPEVLKAYAAAFDPAVIGAYSSPEGTQKVAKDFNIVYEKVGAGPFYTMNHSANAYLIDSDGRTRVSIPYGTTAPVIAHDVEQLLAMK
ncbi:SCO1 protein [Ephemeroptericola cinctiostellae]|uniref:SCO1 protein n=1 Tax=Ephemeroptericola cinctiostellae TaxID=2268024 RepID=A0A345D8D9_9BURK|nr:SCO family protein [Ephemeroptericola cinctiostellae]AXF84627.1 SCO1 protein [Ephemeroptericola cinctiostellae]